MLPKIKNEDNGGKLSIVFQKTIKILPLIKMSEKCAY